MEEAKPIEGITNYPYIYIPQKITTFQPQDSLKEAMTNSYLSRDGIFEKFLESLNENQKKEIFNGFDPKLWKENIEKISRNIWKSSGNDAGYYTLNNMYNLEITSDPIIAFKFEPPFAALSDAVFTLSEKQSTLSLNPVRLYNWELAVAHPTTKAFETREDEYVVLVFSYMHSFQRCIYRGNYKPTMGISFLTNYGNMGMSVLELDGGQSNQSGVFSVRVNKGILDISVSGNSGDLHYGQFTQKFVEKIELKETESPARECYTPQFIVDIISTFLQFTKSGNPLLISKFKKLCYDFTHGLIGDTKKKDESDKKLAQYEQAFNKFESENEKLRRKLSQYEKAFDKLESENEILKDKNNELTEELFGIKSFYNLPLSFKFY
jgi:hypothetical protein